MLELSTLLGSFTQASRLLRLSTALGPDVLLAECVRGEEAICTPYTFTISALSLDASISLRSLLGKPALLELLTTIQGAPRPFHGYITAAEACGSDGGLSRYKLTLQPWTVFAGLGRDSRVFHDMTVIEILETVFAAYRLSGQLATASRFELEDVSVYPVRSLTTQYQESNWAFAERLMSEEGLFYFFEHEGDSASPGLGVHTLVIADHNGAFEPNSQATVRYTQPGAVMKEDSMDRWRSELKLQTTAVELQSWDYRTLDSRPVSAVGMQGDGPTLTSRDVPGAYAYPNRSQGQRMADNHMQALEARRHIFIGAGTVRTLAPATTFTLQGHAVHDSEGGDDARTFMITRTIHLMHNNLSADLHAAIGKGIGQSALAALMDAEHSNSLHTVGNQKGERPLYRNRIDAIKSSVPFRANRTDRNGELLYPRPYVQGQQSAVVVGPSGATIHTDRDHRVKVQFHWQRDGGDGMSHSRLTHPTPEGHVGAPADDSAGTWVRVAAPLAAIAGANWGSNAIPRVGQEVLVDFIEGDMDRPVIIGALYNGRGKADAQNNEVSQGAGAATGNAPAWFPGEAGAHAHPAVLSGLKSQAMQASKVGAGAYSQLVFDDSPGKSRVVLQRHAKPHSGTAELNMGYLRHQRDNQLLNPAGFGAELKTEHSMAVRAGKGMLLSADSRTNATSTQMDSREAHAQITASQALQESLATTAQKHIASIKGKGGEAEPAPAELAAIARMTESGEVVEGVASGGTGTTPATGGQGQAPAYSQPHLQLSSPMGIVAATPASAIIAAGDTSSITAGQDINFAAQGNHFNTAGAGIGLFTYGKATEKDKPNQETGIMLHAATGKVSSQSQSDETRITADKAITVASVTKAVTVAAKQHVLLTAQGAYLKLEGGNIMLHGPGKVEFKATMKELAGPQISSPNLPYLPQPGQIKNFVEFNHHWPDLTPVAGGAFLAVFANGSRREGTLDGKGHARLEDIPPGEVKVYFGEDPRPYERPEVVYAGKTTLESIQQELREQGYDPDELELLLKNLIERD
jgi:type VI secretion system secreted protein VgrG